jgi:hypothetical protein
MKEIEPNAGTCIFPDLQLVFSSRTIVLVDQWR